MYEKGKKVYAHPIFAHPFLGNVIQGKIILLMHFVKCAITNKSNAF